MIDEASLRQAAMGIYAALDESLVSLQTLEYQDQLDIIFGDLFPAMIELHDRLRDVREVLSCAIH